MPLAIEDDLFFHTNWARIGDVARVFLDDHMSKIWAHSLLLLW